MKKTSTLILVIATSFLFGFAFRTILTEKSEAQKMKKVTGIGGIFFKCKEPKKVREWYQGADSTKKGFTQWSPFNEKTKYFDPSTKDFMINYRVANLEALVEELKKNGVTIVDTIQTVDYGKFVHILDVEDNKVELWEPYDIADEKLMKQMGSQTTK